MKQMIMKKMAIALAVFGLTALAAKADATLTYYSGGVETTKSSWTSDASDAAAGWDYDLKAGDTDVLELYGPGPYKLSGDTTDLSVLVAKSCTLTLEKYSASSSESPIVVSHGATLTLLIGEGTSTLQGTANHAGIYVEYGGTVVIDKVEGKTDAACILETSGGDDGAGIGSGRNQSSGKIVIEGGTINATGGDEAAGIGGGNVVEDLILVVPVYNTVTNDTITINGGIVTAKGKDRGAGIGTGFVQAGCTATAYGIYINGGEVTASDMNDGRGVGIGAGEVTGGTVSVNEIVITGGKVTASAYNDRQNAAAQEKAGAGIGTGIVEVGGKATINKIEISGGDVTATGADRGAGIGSGEVYLGHSAATIGSIEISGGKVTANGGAEAAGIGTGVSHGALGEASMEVTNITISGGTVTAKKGANATGSDIGLATSTHSTGQTTLTKVVVTGGSVATGTTMTTPTDGHALVYPLTVENLTPGDTVTIAGLDGYGTEGIVVGEDGKSNLSVPEGEYVFNVNGRLYEATVTTEGGTADFAAATGMTGNGTDIAYGSGDGWFYDGKVLTIDENTTATVAATVPAEDSGKPSSRLPVELVLSDGAVVTLHNVKIEGQSGVPAVTTTDDAENVTLLLDGYNILKGGANAAAVQPAVGATITIDDVEGENIGKLKAEGGEYAAAIGAGSSTACGNVTIAGGHIEADGGTGGSAGIGAGAYEDGDCGIITITGGTVEAQRGDSAAQDVGNGAHGECDGVVVTGGSLVADHGTVTPAPSSIGDEAGHAVTIHNAGWTVGDAIEISGLPEGYGTNDIVASENKSVVVYLPNGNYPLEVNGDWYVVSVDGANGTAVPATFVDVPSVVDAEDLVYTGSEITGVPAGEGYTITGNVATEPGHYTATVTPAAGYLWSDHTMAPVDIDWYIAPAIIDSQYGSVTYDDTTDSWVVTATSDITGPLELPDTLGNVVFDLNGHNIDGADGDATNPDGSAAVHIVASGGEGVNVTFVDNSGAEDGSRIVGGNGAEGTADHPAGGNGGPGILIDDAAANPTVTIDPGVLVIGGYGGAAFDDSGENGGYGGAGIQDASGTGIGTPRDSEINNNGGIIAGGNGGAGANSSLDATGDGGNGGAGVDGFVNNNNGEVYGGDAGNGGSSSTGAAGNGGNGGTGVTGDVAKNERFIKGGDAGDGGSSSSGAAGNGGNGGSGVAGNVEDNTENGAITGGNGGFGGDSEYGDGGAGGAGGAGVEGDVATNDGDITGGDAGDGGSSFTGNGGAGGAGGAGVEGDVATNDGDITGGDAGNGGSSSTGNGGEGGAGGTGVAGNVTDNTENGSIIGGDGGFGGDSEYGDGGAGGNGGAGVDGDVATNDGDITGGNAGDGGDGVTSGNGGAGGDGVNGVVTTNNGDINDGYNGDYGDSSDKANGGAAWLADGSVLSVTAIVKDGENIALTFAVPLDDGLDFDDWVNLSVANQKLAVAASSSLTALANADLEALARGGVEHVSFVYVRNEECSETAAEYVSSDPTAKTVTIRVTKPSEAAGFYRVTAL